MDMAGKRSGSQGFYGWINLSVLAVVGIIGGFYIVSFSYFLDPLLQEFNWERLAVSWTSYINMIALGLSGPAAGLFVMKYGARRSIVLGNLLGAAGFLMLYFHSQLWQLYLGMGILVGTGAGFGGLLASTTVVNDWFVKKRSLGLGVFLAAGGFGGIAMGPAITISINRYGWRNTFLFISLLVLVFAVILPGILVRNKPADLDQVPDGADSGRNDPSIQKPRRAGIMNTAPVAFTAKEAIRTRCLWYLIAYYCMSMLAINALMAHQVRYLIELGIDNVAAASTLSVMTGVMTFSQLGTGWLGMRFSHHKIAVISEILKIAGITILVFTHSLPLVFVYMAVLGIGFGAMIVAVMNIIPAYFGVTHYPKIMGFIRLFWCLIGGLGAPIAGYIYDKTGSYLPAFKGTIFILVIGLVCLIMAKAPPVHPSLKPAEQPDSAVAA